MSEIEKRLTRYIKATGLKNQRYDLLTSEAMELAHTLMDNPLDLCYIAFKYGQAKGYRAAKAEVRA